MVSEIAEGAGAVAVKFTLPPEQIVEVAGVKVTFKGTQQMGALNVVDGTVGAPAAENNAVTVHVPPLAVVTEKLKGIAELNAVLGNTTDPPQEEVIVNVPDAGGQATLTTPLSV